MYFCHLAKHRLESDSCVIRIQTATLVSIERTVGFVHLRSVGDADCTVKREVRISLFFAPGAIFFWLLFVDDDPGQMKLWMRKSVRKTVSI